MKYHLNFHHSIFPVGPLGAISPSRSRVPAVACPRGFSPHGSPKLRQSDERGNSGRVGSASGSGPPVKLSGAEFHVLFARRSRARARPRVRRGFGLCAKACATRAPNAHTGAWPAGSARKYTTRAD